jgi:hypothetical protein
MGEFSPFHWMLVLIICGLLYFIPAIVGRKKRNSSAIFWLNFLLGWTFVGWVAAFIWALTQDSLPTQVVVGQPTQEWIRCTGCGRYSPPGAKFCSTCGAQITTNSP